MELMKNTYLSFEDIEFNSNLVKNFTTLNLLADIPSKYYDTEYKMQYRLDDNVLIESVSYDIYGDTNYWDMIMVYNNIRNFDELPVNYDMVLERASNSLEDWKFRGRLITSITEEEIKQKYNIILEEEIAKNEKFRIINYIIPSYMPDLYTDLKNLKEDKKINKLVLI